MQDDLDVCRECTGTWKVACYSAWYPHSQFWNDFLDDGWEDGDVYTLQACCLRFMCGILFCCLAPVWCCKAILFFLCWPCICGGRAVKNGNCNKTYFRFHRSKQTAFAKQRSKPLAYIETAQPTYPVGNVLHNIPSSTYKLCALVGGAWKLTCGNHGSHFVCMKPYLHKRVYTLLQLD